MSTVLLSPFFHPETISTGRYNTVLAQGLVKRGEQVLVVASHPLYPTWKPEKSDATLPGVEIRRGDAWLRYPATQILRRLFLETWFAVHGWVELLQARSEVRRIVVVFPPSLVAVPLRMLAPRSVRIVGIVHDLQIVHAARGRGFVGRAIGAFINFMERRAFSNCDRIVFLSRSMAERAIDEYGLSRDRCVIHYPFLTLPKNHHPVGNRLASQLPADKNHIVYSGALSDRQEPERLVSLMASLARSNSHIRCHVFSAGPHFDRLKSGPHASVVAFHPLVAKEALEELYARSSLQILPQAPGTADGSLPSKLPNLIAAGVPIFAICDKNSEIVELLKQAGSDAGDFAAGFDAPEVEPKLLDLLHRTRCQARRTRIDRQQPLVQRLFGVDAVVAEVFGDSTKS